jgi:hypothetical protein
MFFEKEEPKLKIENYTKPHYRNMKSNVINKK